MIFKYKGTLLLSAAVAISAAALLPSCEDDFDYRGKSKSAVSFQVEIPEGWSSGMTVDERSSSTRCVSVEELSGDGDNPLYLHTIEADNPAPNRQANGSRASQINDKEAFIKRYPEFSLSAVCYTGDYPAEGANTLTPNLAYNLNYNTSDGTPAKGDRIYMPSSGNVKFFAFAPTIEDSKAEGEATPAISLSGENAPGSPKITYVPPTDVKKQFDLMTCSSSDATLSFQHALTAIKIKCGDDMLAGKVTKVTISGVYASGVHIPGSNEWTIPAGTKTASYTIADEITLPSKNDDDSENPDITHTPSGRPIAGYGNDNLTFMLIPQALPEGAKLTVEFTDKISGAVRKIEGALAGKTWLPGKIVTYSISPSSIHISPKLDFPKDPAKDILPYSGVWYGIDMKSRVEITQGSDIKTIEETPTISYSADNGTSWSDAVINGDALVLARQDDYAKLSKDLKTNTVGTEESPRYLLEDTKGESANCYMIDQAGYYSLPTVYGNSIKGNTENPSAYTIDRTKYLPEGETAADGLQYFPNHDNQRITDSKIPGCYDAVLAWQDAPDLIDDVKLKGDKILFRIRPETLTQGNALIVVRNASKTILWSWHIWVTPYKDKWLNDGTLCHTRCTIEGTEYNYDLTPCNLGYCDPHDGNDERQVKVKAVFDMSKYGGSEKSEIEIGEFTQAEFKGSLAGDNTYYQWGRKDPMLPGIYNDKTICYTYHKKGSSTSIDDTEFTMENKPVFNAYKDTEGRDYSPSRNPVDQYLKGVDLKYTIQNPHIMVMSDLTDSSDKGTADFKYRNHWHIRTTTDYLDAGKIMYNLWNSTAYSEGENTSESIENAQHITKTIYDPCPAGFCMPPAAAFRGLAKTVGYSAGIAEGVSVSISNNICTFTYSEGTIKFPITGMRNKSLRTIEINTVTSTNPNALTAEEFNKISFPAFKKVTYVSCASLGSEDQVLLFLVDLRDNSFASGLASSNSYGLSVRPMKEQ